jgi:acetyltransferase
MNIPIPSLEHFFHPQGIVIIGASADPGKLGYSIARNLVEIGYPGVVHYVNPRGGHLFGRPVYPDLQHIPDPIDLAVLLIPAPATPQALRACGESGIRAAIIASSGFRETGAEGARLESELLEIARHFGMRIIGPNCIGLIDTNMPLDTTFLKPPPPPKGNIAFISHSGATCAAVIDWSRGQGFGFSRLVSLGNQIDVNETDMLLSIAADPSTRSLALYLEGISDGRRFVETALRVTREKPVVVLKSGRYASGQRAAASHTGALAGQETAFDAAFKRAGIIRANTVEELFEWAYTLAASPLPKGRSMAVLTSAGGLGVAAADALEANDLRMAELAVETQTALQAILPPAASTHNPVDMLASATPQQFASCLNLLLTDPNVDGVLMIILPPPISTDMTVSDAILPIIKLSLSLSFLLLAIY